MADANSPTEDDGRPRCSLWRALIKMALIGGIVLVEGADKSRFSWADLVAVDQLHGQQNRLICGIFKGGRAACCYSCALLVVAAFKKIRASRRIAGWSWS